MPTVAAPRWAAAASAPPRPKTTTTPPAAPHNVGRPRSRAAFPMARRGVGRLNTAFRDVDGLLAEQEGVRLSDESLQVSLVQWYPGHIARAERQLKEQLSKVDIVLQVGVATGDSSRILPTMPPRHAVTLACGAGRCWTHAFH